MLKAGGQIDLTTSSDPQHLEEGEVRVGEGLKKLLDLWSRYRKNNFFFFRW